MAITYHAGRRIQGLSTNLIAYLKLNDNVLDETGYNNGTVTGTTAYTTGKLGGSTKAFSFNGSSIITLENKSNFDFELTDAFSVCCWAKHTGSDSDTIFGKDDGYLAGSQGWGAYYASANVARVYIGDTAGSNILSSSANPNDGNWHHVCITYDGSSNMSGLKLYLDNVVATGSSHALSGTMRNNVKFSIGALANSNLNNAYTGAIDMVSVWSKELTSSEISDMYNAGTDTINEDTKPYNAQVGSRFEETDTRKMYYRDDIDFKELDGNEATNYRSDSWYEQLSGETP